MTEEIEGERPCGHPRQWWKDTLKTDIEKCAQETMVEESNNRERCREIMEVLNRL